MKAGKIAMAAAVVGALGGCVGVAKQHAMKTAREMCTKDGGTFVPKGEPESRGGMFGEVVVRGECHQPGDPGYVPPAAPAR